MASLADRTIAASRAEHDVLADVVGRLDDDQRQDVQGPFRRLPEPLTMATCAGMRLDELALHSWDVRVALDVTDAERAASTTRLRPWVRT